MHEFEVATIAGPAHACAQAAAGTAAGALHDALDREVTLLDRSLALAGLPARGLLTTIRCRHLDGNDARKALRLAGHAGTSAERIVRLLEQWWSSNPGEDAAREWLPDAPEMCAVLHRLASGLRGRLRTAEVILGTRLTEEQMLVRAATDEAVSRTVAALRKI